MNKKVKKREPINTKENLVLSNLILDQFPRRHLVESLIWKFEIYIYDCESEIEHLKNKDFGYLKEDIRKKTQTLKKQIQQYNKIIKSLNSVLAQIKSLFQD